MFVWTKRGSTSGSVAALLQAPDRAERVSELADLAAVGELQRSAVRHATRQEQRVAKLIEASDLEVGHGSRDAAQRRRPNLIPSDPAGSSIQGLSLLDESRRVCP